MKKYIVTEEDLEKLKESLENAEGFWYIDIKLDDWVETLNIYENEK